MLRAPTARLLLYADTALAGFGAAEGFEEGPDWTADAVELEEAGTELEGE